MNTSQQTASAPKPAPHIDPKKASARFAAAEAEVERLKQELAAGED